MVSNKSCEPEPNLCKSDANEKSNSFNGFKPLEIDENIEKFAFDTVRIWNTETPVSNHFLRMDCLRSVMLNVTQTNIEYLIHATLTETDCKKNKLLDGDLTDLDFIDLDVCISLPDRYDCVFQLVFNPFAIKENARIKLIYSECSKY